LLPEDGISLADVADPDIGIEDAALPPPCTTDPLPPAMRPSRQHLLTRLALYTWLELELDADPATRASACQFLDTLDALDDVRLE